MAENVGLGDDPTIPKLIGFLRTAFQQRHFDDVQEILINRWEKFRVEIERLKEENHELRSDNEKLKEENHELRSDNEKLKDENHGLRLDNKKLKEENDGLRLDKFAIETENQNLKRKLLEKMHSGTGLGEPPVVNNFEAGLRANDTVSENGNCDLSRVKVETYVSNCNGTVPENGNSSFVRAKIEVDESGFDEHTAQTRHSLKAGSKGHEHRVIFDNSQAGSKGHEDRVCIEISDSDSDSDLGTILPEKSAQTSPSKRITKESESVTLKRKQESETQNCRTQPSKRVCLQEQVAVERTSLSNMSDRDGFSDSDSDHFADEPYNQQTLNNTSAREADPTQNSIDASSIPSASTPISAEVEIPRFNPILSEEQHFDCRITTKCELKVITNLIKTELKDDKTNLNLFRKSSFGHFLDVSEYLKPSSQVMWALLVREAEVNRTSEMWFLVNGIPVRFSLMEYALITGLNCSRPPADMEQQFKSRSFCDKHFWGQDGVVNIDALKAKFKALVAQHKKSKRRNHANWEIIKVASLLFVTAVLIRRQEPSFRINKKWLGLVDNLDMFNKYPWGFVSFGYLLRQLRKDLKAKAKVHQESKKEITITYAGFVIPLMVLAFECLPALATKFASPRHDIDQTLPRICRWKTTWNNSPNYTAVKEALGVSKDIRTLLYPSEEESNLPHIQGISFPEEERPNRILEKMVEVLERGGSIAFPFEQVVMEGQENPRMARDEEVHGETEVHNDDHPATPRVEESPSIPPAKEATCTSQNVGTSEKVEFSSIKKYLDEQAATIVQSLRGEMNDQVTQMLKALSNRNEPSENSNAKQRGADPNIPKSF